MTETASAEPKVGARAWYTLIVLTLVYTCHYIDRSIISILIEPIKQEFTLSDSQLGVLTGLIFVLLYVSAGIPMGLLIDRVNRRNLLAVMVFVWSAFTALCGLAQSYWQLVTARLFVGMAESGGSPTAMSMLTDIFPPHLRSRAVGFFWMSAALGAALALAVGGFVAQTHGWRAAFFVAGAPGVLLALLLLATVREPRRGASDVGSADTDKAPTIVETWRYATRNRMFVCAALGMIANSVAGAGIMIWQAPFLVRAHGLSLLNAGLTVGVIALVCGATSTFVGGFIADKLSVRQGLRGAALVPAVSGLLTAIAGVYMVTAPTAATAIAGVALWEICYRLYFGPGNNLVLSTVLPRMRGIAVSATQLGTNLIGFGLGPTIIGVVSDVARRSVGEQYSLQWGMASVLVFSLITALLFFLAARSTQPPGNLTPASLRP